MANTYLTRSKSSPTSDKIGTISFWFKRSKIGFEQTVFLSGSGTIDSSIYFNGSTDKLHVYDYQSGAFNFEYVTTRVFRDVNAWTHLTIEIDTTLTTASDRVKIYINGVRETVFDTATTPNQDITPLFFTSANPFYIGAYRGTGGYFDGLLSHFHYTDGTAYGASTFGSTDSTTGEWQINTSPSITMGNNGFTILKDGNTITDQSSNSNDFTLGGGTLTNTEDCPSNVFATFNPLIRPVNIFYAKGNTRIEILSGASWQSGFGTLGMEKGQGKYYMEFKIINGTKAAFGIADFKSSGVIDRVQKGENRYIGEYANSYAYHYNGLFYYNGNSTSSGWDSFTTANIIGMAVDMDNMKLYFHKDGTYQNSGNPTAGTGGYSINDPENCYLPAVAIEVNAACANFGNGSFDGTAISSEGTNASGNGKFEYDVPTGYTALSTKGLNL